MAKKREQRESLYLTVVTLDNGNASLGQYVEQPTADSKVITTQKRGSDKLIQKNYNLFDEVEGLIRTVGVYDKELESGASWEITSISITTPEGSIETIQVNFKSRYSSSLITRLENIVLTEPVIIRVFRIKQAGKTDKKGNQIFNEILIPYQKDAYGVLVSVKNKYAKVFDESDTAKLNNLNTNKLPEFREIPIVKNGITTIDWDTSEHEESLRQICMKIDNEIKKLSSVKVDVTEQKTNLTEELSNEQQNDDLPF